MGGCLITLGYLNYPGVVNYPEMVNYPPGGAQNISFKGEFLTPNQVGKRIYLPQNGLNSPGVGLILSGGGLLITPGVVNYPGGVVNPLLAAAPPGPPPELPYFVRRSRLHNLPVYLGLRQGRRLTALRHIHGDIWVSGGLRGLWGGSRGSR